MSDVAVVPAAPPIAIPIRQWLPYIIFATVLMLYLLYVVGLEQGATSLIGGHMLHEWMHDARHLLGFPCH
jgi:cobalt transporter subunit CbtB